MASCVVIPGDCIGSLAKHRAGAGTNVRNGKIYSTLTGKVAITDETTVGPAALPRLSVQSKRLFLCGPKIGSIALCKVLNIIERQARVTVISIDGCALKSELHGYIRKEDVRATEKDTVEIFNSFRPNDIVRARVLSLGEGHMYSLSTASNELGVIVAYSEAGTDMVPVSWCEMQCSKTGLKEKRKVAKVVNAIPA